MVFSGSKLVHPDSQLSVPKAPINETLSKPVNPANEEPERSGLFAEGIKEAESPLSTFLPVRANSLAEAI